MEVKTQSSIEPHIGGQPSRTLMLTLMVLLAAAGLLALLKLQLFIHDDAFITLRYARTLAETGAPTWNPGEIPVEGYTSPLHLLLNAGLALISFDHIAGLRTIGVFGFALMIVGVGAGLRAMKIDPLGSIAAYAVVVSIPPLAWIWGGLETTLGAGLVSLGLAGTLAAARPRTGVMLALAASLAFALAYLTRPEFAVVNLIAGLGLLAFSEGSFVSRVSKFVSLGIVSGVVCGVHMVLRYFYYGEFLPLTYYAKVDFSTAFRWSNGVEYILRNLDILPVVVILIIALGLIRFKLSRPGWIALVVLIGQCVLLVNLGGDHMPYGRMLVPILPALAFIAADAISRSEVGNRNVLVCATVGLTLFQSIVVPRAFPDRAASIGSMIGAYIDQEFEPDQVIALATAGSTPFHARSHTFIDTLGLNNKEIALRKDVPLVTEWQNMPGHGKGDGAYVLSRQPDVIVIGPANGVQSDEASNWFLTGFELHRTEEFHRCYRRVDDRIDPTTVRVWSKLMFNTPLEFTYYVRTCAKDSG